jgi:dihydroneopterin aldolase
MLTTIQIAGLQTFGYHGLFEEERSLGQKFTFDIDATVNRLRRTGTTDWMDRSATMPWWRPR